MEGLGLQYGAAGSTLVRLIHPLLQESRHLVRQLETGIG